MSISFIKYKANTARLQSDAEHNARHPGKKVEYSIQNINKDREEQNECKEKMTGMEVLKKAKERVAEIDKKKPPKRIKKDRVITICAVIPLPRDIENFSDNDYKFFKEVIDQSEKTQGKENIIQQIIHRDEIHEYIYENQKKESKSHIHITIIPEVKDIGVNAKKQLTATNMSRQNREIDERIKEKLNIKFLQHEPKTTKLKTKKALPERVLNNDKRKINKKTIYK